MHLTQFLALSQTLAVLVYATPTPASTASSTGVQEGELSDARQLVASCDYTWDSQRTVGSWTMSFENWKSGRVEHLRHKLESGCEWVNGLENSIAQDIHLKTMTLKGEFSEYAELKCMGSNLSSAAVSANKAVRGNLKAAETKIECIEEKGEVKGNE